MFPFPDYRITDISNRVYFAKNEICLWKHFLGNLAVSICMSYTRHLGMDLLPVAADYDAISEQMRQFAAGQYMNMIKGLSNYVDQALSDPAGIHDAEPGRIQAHLAIVKLHATLIKELGLLYRVQDRPAAEEQEETVSLEEHETALRLAQEREDRAVAAAAEHATAAALAAVAHREVIDLEAARDRVARGLRALGR